MSASFYRGRLWHRRARPLHRFSRTLLMALADVREIDAAPGGVLRLAGRWPITLRRQDHLPHPEQSLAERVEALVTPVLGRSPSGAMRLLSQPRCFGLTFDPVSFVYCLAGKEGSDGAAEIEAIVAEVTNTPWGERHAYVLIGGERDARAMHHYRAGKAMHVSPFFPMEHEYAFGFMPPGAALRGTVENRAADGVVFRAGFTLDRIAEAGPSAIRAIRGQVFAPFATLVGIYFEALRLAWKGARFHPHPRKRIAITTPEATGAGSGGQP